MKGIDELYGLFKTRKRITLSEAAGVLKIPKTSALKWAKMLQDDGLIDIEFSGDDIYLAWAAGKKEKYTPPPVQAKERPIQSIAKSFEHLMDDYESKIESIKSRSDELQVLSKERAELVQKKYLPLERKFEAELQLLHDQLSEKEHQMAELEKRIRSMPDKMSKIDDQIKKLDQIEAYTRKNVLDARARIRSETARATEAQAAIDEHMKEVGNMLEQQTSKLKKVEKELIRMRKIEQWMVVQQHDLEGSLEETAADRKESLKSFSSLKSLISTDYLKNYIKELTTLKDKHAREAHNIQKEEQELNSKMREARKDLLRLTTEGKALAERFEHARKRRGKKGADGEWGEFEKDLESLASSNIE